MATRRQKRALDKLPAERVLRPKIYELLCAAVESGVRFGWNRAHKHEDHPCETDICDKIESSVLNEICSRFDFPEEI